MVSSVRVTGVEGGVALAHASRPYPTSMIVRQANGIVGVYKYDAQNKDSAEVANE
ncbi:MAG TPA: hypothetical protein VF772_18410 [Terriglobales bacterium]